MLPTLSASTVLTRAGVDRDRLRKVMPRVDPQRVRVGPAPRLIRLVWPQRISAVTMPWAIYIRPSLWEAFSTAVSPARAGSLMVHELMHVEQLLRYGVVRHGLRYVTDYLRGRIRGLGHWDAYREIPFEQEARAAARMVVGIR